MFNLGVPVMLLPLLLPSEPHKALVLSVEMDTAPSAIVGDCSLVACIWRGGENPDVPKRPTPVPYIFLARDPRLPVPPCRAVTMEPRVAPRALAGAPPALAFPLSFSPRAGLTIAKPLPLAVAWS